MSSFTAMFSIPSRGILDRLGGVRLALDAEDRMVGRDPHEFTGGRVGADASEELADLPLPATEVLAQDRLLLGVRNLDRPERLASAPEQQIPAPSYAEIANPLRVPARRDEVAIPVKSEQIDGRPPGLSSLRPGTSSTREPATLIPRRVNPATMRLKTLRVNQSGLR